MKLFGRLSATAACFTLLVSLFLLGLSAEDAHAQAQSKWLDLGDMADVYYDSGSEGIAGPGIVWPYIKGDTRSLRGYHDGYELMVGTTDWMNEEGDEYEYKISFANDSRIGTSTYPQEFELVSKYPDPEVIVGLREDFRINPDQIDRVNPNLKSDYMLRTVTNLDIGVTMVKRVYQFSQEYHDDYHITEIVLRNTGNADDDDEMEYPEQDLTGVYLWWDMRWGQSGKTSDVIGRTTRWGGTNMHDIVRDGEIRANYTWCGRVGDFTEYDPIGASAVDATGSHFPSGQDTTGRLHAIGIPATFAVHAPPSVDNQSVDDPTQPSTMYWGDANGMQATGTNPLDRGQMEKQYTEWFTAGVKRPFYAKAMEQDGEYAHQANTTYITAAGARVAQGYGPYDIPAGDSVRIVIGQGVQGIPYDDALTIGRKFKKIIESGQDQYTDIEFDADGDGTIQDDERMDKNEWAINAATDSTLMMIDRAMANYDSGFDIPQPPAPPSRFNVQSSAGGVQMDWEYPYEDPAGGFEIYRAQNFFEGTVEDDYEYQKVAELPGSARSFKDTVDVARGLNYFYYISAVGPKVSEITPNPPAGTPTNVRLRSSRYYTQTYAPATALRRPGESLSEVRVVPNPFHVGASANLRYPGAERIGFLDIPGQATIKIYTERGDLVKTIQHTDGTGDEFWDLQTDAQQMLVSGLYIAAVTDNDSGETTFKKFIVVR